MVNNTLDFVNDVLENRRKAGTTEKACCNRFLADLHNSETDENFEYYFDVEEAQRHIKLVNSLTRAEGQERTLIKTRGFQNFIIGNIYGWKYKKNKQRRYREAYIQIGRQNGKSLIAGAIANSHASFCDYNLGRVFCTATKQDQANIVWKEIEKFIRADIELNELYKIINHTNIIKSYLTGTEIKSIGRDTKSADGFSSILAIVDEYHAHPTEDMYHLMRDGQINIDGSLLLAISTAGFNLNSPCYTQYKFAKNILSGLVKKDSLFIYIAELDKDDDLSDIENWKKANPFLLENQDYTTDKVREERFRDKYVEAKEKGGKELTNFLTKSLNMWVMHKDNSYIDLEAFKKCESDLTIEDMRGRSCYLGFDLSSGGDLTSISLVFPYEEGATYIYSHSFLPSGRLLEHEKTDKAPYRQWAIAGNVTITDGGFGQKTDYKYIIRHLKDLINENELQILACGYDAYNAGAFLSDLEFLGCELIEIKQSARFLNKSTVDFQLTVKSLKVLYDKSNSLLKWSIANAEVTHNSFDEIKINKISKNARIDAVDAVINAWAVMIEEDTNTTVNVNSAVEDWLKSLK